MQIGTADTSRPEAQQHFAGTGFGNVGRFDAQVVLGVDATGKHGDLLKKSGRRYCSVSQPVEKRLYA